MWATQRFVADKTAHAEVKDISGSEHTCLTQALLFRAQYKLKDMFKPATIKVFSIFAIILSVVGLLISILLTQQYGPAFFVGITTWLIFLWASYIGFRLSAYKLQDEEHKKVGVRIYLIILSFIAYLVFGLTIGPILSVVLLATLWGLKRNYDDWNEKFPTVTEE
ncbi:hypothetical protein [Hymenobacter terrestris]|uniref:Uncharacterized protein n=1 Tax=Hymenobacter terrestris TaxID=2748310 RepID=A0ABX2Q542_9BACT|nr:hypothetical protein [Hymenobacter terrestris]NVO86095.1 hypothetical protein [Hymenobacter terrestris]